MIKGNEPFYIPAGDVVHQFGKRNAVVYIARKGGGFHRRKTNQIKGV